MTETNTEFFDAVQALVDDVRGFLNNDDGSDDQYIEAMSGSVHDVLVQAQNIPALRDWVAALSRKDAERALPPLDTEVS
jgi:hypothetical protein